MFAFRQYALVVLVVEILHEFQIIHRTCLSHAKNYVTKTCGKHQTYDWNQACI